MIFGTDFLLPFADTLFHIKIKQSLILMKIVACCGYFLYFRNDCSTINKK